MKRSFLPALVLLVACDPPPPQAPEELDELVAYLFEHLVDEDPAAMEAGAVNLDTWLDERIAETEEGYEVTNLTEDMVDDLGVDVPDLDRLGGAAVGHTSVYSADSLVGTTVTTSSEDLYGYESFEREWDGDPEAFLAHDEVRLDSQIEAVSSYAGMIKVTTRSQVQYRWVESPEGPALFERTWLLEPCTVTPEGLVSVDAQYFLWGVVPDADGGSRNIQTTWVIAELFIDMEESTVLNLMIDSMGNMATKLDEYIEKNGEP